jgi:hypothetical protein
MIDLKNKLTDNPHILLYYSEEVHVSQHLDPNYLQFQPREILLLDEGFLVYHGS